MQFGRSIHQRPLRCFSRTVQNQQQTLVLCRSLESSHLCHTWHLQKHERDPPFGRNLRVWDSKVGPFRSSCRNKRWREEEGRTRSCGEEEGLRSRRSSWCTGPPWEMVRFWDCRRSSRRERDLHPLHWLGSAINNLHYYYYYHQEQYYHDSSQHIQYNTNNWMMSVPALRLPPKR